MTAPHATQVVTQYSVPTCVNGPIAYGLLNIKSAVDHLRSKRPLSALITDLRAEAPRSRRTSAHYERLIALLYREAPYRRQRR